METDLGAQLRRVREERGLSLRSVANAAGISPSLLSQVETGKTHPSVSTLYALVNHLEVSIDELLGTRRPDDRAPLTTLTLLSDSPAPSPSNDVIQRAEDNPVIEMENGVRWERLAIGSSRLVDPLITTYQPGGGTSMDGRLVRHSGIEYAYLLSGELTLQLEFETHILRAGDSMCFDSTRPHRYHNHTDGVSKGIWFVVGRQDPAHQERQVGAMLDEYRSRGMNSATDMLDAIDRLASDQPRAVE